jgi:uncharacterized protein (DUF1697 family)
VAFLRNLNQGQRGHVTTAGLVGAFEAAGARDVHPVRANGTVLFDAPNPDECLGRVLDELAGTAPWADVAFVRDRAWLAERASEFPADVVPSLVEVSLFDGALADPAPVPGLWCTIVRAGDGYAITVNERPGTSQATPSLERLLGSPVTSRSATTIRSVLDVR